jgi:hypothetical protein
VCQRKAFPAWSYPYEWLSTEALAGMKRNIFISALVSFALLTASASNAGASGGRSFQVLLRPDGSGRIFMNDGSNPDWKACRPDLTECTPFAKGNFETGAAPPETVFWAGGEILTPLWKGNVHPTAPPSVSGEVRANQVVTPVAGRWAGGWEDDYDELTLSICEKSTGESCLTINHEGGGFCGERGTLIDPAFTGRYLRVTDRRYGSGTAFAGVGHPFYFREPEPTSGPTVSVAVVGKIAPADGPPSVKCGPPPLIAGAISRSGTASYECRVVGCQVALVARRGRRAAHLGRRVPPSERLGQKPTEPLRFSPSALSRLGGGPVRLTLKINGRQIAHRTVGAKLAERPSKTSKRASISSTAPQIHVALDPDGSGSLSVEPAGSWEWKNCDPTLTTCTPVGAGSQISTAGASEGTVFTATLNGRTLVSPRWDGNVYFAKPPSLRGTIKANEFIAPENGDWRGGWPRQIGITQLAACRNPDGSECITLSNYHIPCVAGGAEHPGGTVLDPVLTGWYLRLAEQVEILGTAPVILHPEEEAPFAASGIATVAVLGRIEAATGPQSADCGIPPQLQASISRSGVAAIRCGLGCHAQLEARCGNRRARTSTDVSPTLFSLPAKKLPKLRFSQRSSKHLAGCMPSVVVRLNGEIAAKRRVRLIYAS